MDPALPEMEFEFAASWFCRVSLGAWRACLKCAPRLRTDQESLEQGSPECRSLLLPQPRKVLVSPSMQNKLQPDQLAIRSMFPPNAGWRRTLLHNQSKTPACHSEFKRVKSSSHRCARTQCLQSEWLGQSQRLANGHQSASGPTWRILLQQIHIGELQWTSQGNWPTHLPPPPPPQPPPTTTPQPPGTGQTPSPTPTPPQNWPTPPPPHPHNPRPLYEVGFEAHRRGRAESEAPRWKPRPGVTFRPGELACVGEAG